MTMATDETQPNGSNRLILVRAGIGLAQGVGLYLLSECDKTAAGMNPSVFAASALAVIFLPIVALGSIGALRGRTALIWLVITAVVLLALGAYDGTLQIRDDRLWPSPSLIAVSAAGLFIAHHLVLPADHERRWIASYDRYFDEGWKDGVRIVLAVCFVGALWLLLFLGANLFKLIGLKFVETLIRNRWFAFPISTMAFAVAVHLTDMQAGLVRGIRTVALTLLSVLLPLMALIGAGFLAALPFTGLQPLWATKSAGSILLAACAALIILINAAYQAGEREGFPPLALKWAARVTTVLIAPLAVIAAYGIWLRAAQHGLTPERIYAGGCVLVATCYGGGYLVAAFRRGPWLKTLETANIAAAHLIVLILLALFSPVADPQRLSVASQVARLESGRISPDKFDYDFLRFHSGRAGQKALADLANLKLGPHADDIADRAKQAQGRKYQSEPAKQTPADREALVTVAGGRHLPDGFLNQAWDIDPFADCVRETRNCSAIVADLNKDKADEVVVLTPVATSVYGLVNGHWTVVGRIAQTYCSDVPSAVAAGRYRIEPPAPVWQDIEIDGQRKTIQSEAECPASPAPPQAKADAP